MAHGDEQIVAGFRKALKQSNRIAVIETSRTIRFVLTRRTPKPRKRVTGNG